MTSGVRIEATGLQALVQDRGRPGYAALGVAESGAMDAAAAAQANELVGNPADAALLESLGGGLRLAAVGDQVVAVTGADVPLEVTGAPVAHRPASDRPFALLDGQVLALDVPRRGLRAYVGVRGGLAAASALGSRSTDLMSGEGPAPLASGDVVPVGTPPWPSIVGLPQAPTPLPGDHLDAHVRLGPRDDWFTPDALASLGEQDWVVREDSNRIGVRLDGEPLRRSRDGELPSEGAVAGSIQVPTDGRPVIFMRDHPVTGGYPVIGVVRAADVDLIAQLPPGATIRFVVEE